MKNKILLLMVVWQVGLVGGVLGQSNVGINTTAATPNASAILDINSSTLGLLIPRTPTVSLPATLAAIAPGLLFYNTTTNLFNFNNSATTTANWIPIVSGATTNYLTQSPPNTIYSNVNGVYAAPASAVNSVSNTSTTNSLSTTVNGVTGTGVNIINSNGLSLTTTNLTSTVNGFGSTALDLTPAITAVAWNLTGNANATSSSFLGTTTQYDLVFKANSTEYMRISSATATPGYIGIGTTAPKSTLEVNGSFGTTIVKPTIATVTLDNSASVWYINSSTTTTVNFPTPSSTYTNRMYMISNRSGASVTTSSYIQLSTGSSIATLANATSIQIICDGTSWLQIK